MLYSDPGVTWVAEGGPRVVNQMLYARWPVFSGSNALTFSSSTGQYSASPAGYSGIITTLLTGGLYASNPQTTNMWTFNGGRVTFVTGVATYATGIPFTVAGTTGTMVVGGNSTLQSTVDVASAALMVDGNMSVATGPLTVEGTLGGTGTINIDVSINGGTLSPGDLGLGTLSVVGNVSFSGGLLDISGTGSTLTSLADSGNLLLTGAETLDVLGSLTAGTYTLASYGGSESGTFGTVNIPPGDSISYGTGTDSAVTLTVPGGVQGGLAVVAVPEPGTFGLLAAAIAAAWALRRRRPTV